MMKNYERYLKTTPEQYDRLTIMSFFCRLLPDRRIIPLISQIKNKKVLDVGLGTGSYTRILAKNNVVVGVDRNPHLCTLPVKVYEGDATELGRLAGDEKFNVVFSTWMTEYLNEKQLSTFFAESKKVLADNGKLITTVISKYGLGFIYVTAAKILRGIDKYNYRKKQIGEKLREAGFIDVRIIRLDTWLGIPWAYLAVAE